MTPGRVGEARRSPYEVGYGRGAEHAAWDTAAVLALLAERHGLLAAYARHGRSLRPGIFEEEAGFLDKLADILRRRGHRGLALK